MDASNSNTNTDIFSTFSDITKLSKDFDGLDNAKMYQNCIDLGHIANNIVPIRQRWSMEKLVNHFVSLIYLFQFYDLNNNKHFLNYHM